MDQLITFNVKDVARSDKPTENFHPSLQFPLALSGILASFN